MVRAKVQKRKSVSLAPEVYGVAQRSAERDRVPVAQWVTSAIEAYAHPDEIPLPPCPSDRCHVCGWPLAPGPREGCVRGNCARRPVPDEPTFALPTSLTENDDAG